MEVTLAEGAVVGVALEAFGLKTRIPMHEAMITLSVVNVSNFHFIMSLGW